MKYDKQKHGRLAWGVKLAGEEEPATTRIINILMAGEQEIIDPETELKLLRRIQKEF